jgi:hypothetical protein
MSLHESTAPRQEAALRFSNPAIRFAEPAVQKMAAKGRGAAAAAKTAGERAGAVLAAARAGSMSPAERAAGAEVLREAADAQRTAAAILREVADYMDRASAHTRAQRERRKRQASRTMPRLPIGAIRRVSRHHHRAPRRSVSRRTRLAAISAAGNGGDGPPSADPDAVAQRVSHLAGGAS